MKKEGVLYYDRADGRYDVLFTDGSYYGGLHCGNTFEVKLPGNDVWEPTRIEHSHRYEEERGDGWYLIGLMDRVDVMSSLAVRM